MNGDLLVCGDGFIATMALSVCRSIFCHSTPGLPIALFSAPNHICPGTCTDFTNLSANGTSFIWSFPGGNPSTSTDQNPTGICYNTPGNYGVTLIASNATASDTLFLPNYITVYPNPAPQGILQSGDTLFANQGATTYQWYYNGNLIPGATNYFYVTGASGDYNLVATNNNGCEVEAVINDVIAEIQMSVGSLQLAIFPNPVSETLTIKRYLLSGTPNGFSIYNVLGEKIYMAFPPLSLGEGRGGEAAWTIDCSLIPPGMYAIEIISGDKIYRTKFVKQ
jgi:hypothetical protein